MKIIKYIARILGVAIISFIAIFIFSLLFSDRGEGINELFGEGSKDIVYQYLGGGILLFVLGKEGLKIMKKNLKNIRKKFIEDIATKIKEDNK